MRSSLFLVVRFVPLLIMLSLLTACNVFRSKGIAHFEKAEKPNFGRLVIVGPAGWQCIEFEKTRTQSGTSDLQVAGIGKGKCPMFGGFLSDSTDFPQSSQEFELEPNVPRLIHHSPDRSYEIYALITNDPSLPGRLGK